MLFFIGATPAIAKKLQVSCMISVNTCKGYRNLTLNSNCILDSGAFTLVNKYGGYPAGFLPKYASEVLGLINDKVIAVVSQDYMCEDFVLAKTGLTIEEHQRFTIYRYKALKKLLKESCYLMPVLQGYKPQEYVSHIKMYGDLLQESMWVGVGSVCKRNKSFIATAQVLMAIKEERPDLKLHGFGIKKTALKSHIVRELLYSADSYAWSFNARMNKLNPNCPCIATKYWNEVNNQPTQLELPVF